MPIIIGREPEIKLLDTIYHSNSAEFLAVYGRRRIGKTFLISHYFKAKGIYLEITGSKQASLTEQLKNYQREFQALFPELATKPPQAWSDAFYQLKEAIDTIDSKQKIIIFLDELPWLASPKSGFLPALEYIWNRHFSRFNNLILIVCGSAASWMLNKIVNNKEGLYGRLSASLPLYPYKLKTIEAYLSSRHVHLNQRQIVELTMSLGGVPKYLSYVRPGQSCAQTVNELFFTQHGQLFLEFPKLFSSLFDNSQKHYDIVKALSQKRYGIYQKELLKASQLPQSGTSSKILDELEASGFIGSMPMFGKSHQNRKWRLIDEYCYFYLNWVEERRSNILNGSDQHYWESIFNSPAWTSWAGFSFETICLKHIDQIKKKLGISGINTTESHWANENAQIDLIIDRSDNCINIIEIKFSNDEYSITKDYAEKLRKKKEAFREETKTKKAIFITMLTPYGTKKNAFYQEIVQNEIILEDLFT
jgi:AAA+ ATPase superfamily predicted ATPase